MEPFFQHCGPVVYAKPHIDLRKIRFYLGPEALRKATGNGKRCTFSIALVTCHFKDFMDRFLRSLPDERAGVHDDDIGFAKIPRYDEPFAGKMGEHALSVYLVLAASEVLQGYGRHYGKSFER
jgi:hypothetical protein